MKLVELSLALFPRKSPLLTGKGKCKVAIYVENYGERTAPSHDRRGKKTVISTVWASFPLTVFQWLMQTIKLKCSSNEYHSQSHFHFNCCGVIKKHIWTFPPPPKKTFFCTFVLETLIYVIPRILSSSKLRESWSYTGFMTTGFLSAFSTGNLPRKAL